MSLGLKDAGFTPIAAYDNASVALDVYNHNLGHHARMADLKDPTDVIRELRARRPDMIAGGPPCQEFSSAGKRCEGDRARLMVVLAEIAVAVGPPWFLLENVDPARHSRAFSAARQVLSQHYGVTLATLDASYCGVPQRRRRFVCIGRRGAPDDFLREALMGGLAQKPMTVRDHVGNTFGTDHYYLHPRFSGRRAIYSIDEPAPTIRTTLRNPPHGYKRHKADSADVNEARALTLGECAALQTFPEGWTWLGTSTQIATMIGNAVPPALATRLGRAILAYERAASAVVP
jgi:DNA (cytosine-5)-methyltransferase 1